MTPKSTTAIVGGTVIDGTGGPPVEDAIVLIDDAGSIVSVAAGGDIDLSHAQTIRADGQYIIPGLLDANVHLVLHCDADVLLRFEPGQYDDLVLEASQIALKAGFTTVFDTWGPLEALRRVRDRINDGGAIGSRIFFAGNIIGLGGPWSPDFYSPGDINPGVIADVNRQWTQGVGDELPWQSAQDVQAAVREYIATSGIDFVKYACSVHKDLRFLTFSPDVQQVIVDEAHAAGLTAQSCTCTAEALKVAMRAGVDLLQHGDITGRHPMPQALTEQIASEQLPCVAFLTTDRFMEAVRKDPKSRLGDIFLAKQDNDRALVAAGARLLLGTDGGVYAPSWPTSPVWGPFLAVPDWYGLLGTSHMYWIEAARSLGMKPMDILLSVTRNIAEAYGKGGDLGTLESGKRADLIILDGNPLDDVANYARISRVFKDGRPVDRERLPESPILTK